jgi:SAM-dependent methyltransferase
MAQITGGIRAILSNPAVYSCFQYIMGGDTFRSRFVKEFVRPHAGMRVLDIGCGPADILAYLPGLEYWGFDISETYIQRARARYGCNGQFFCKELADSDLEGLPAFDVVLALGLVHHLDDDIAEKVLRLARTALRPGGRLLSVDPCLDPGQNFVSRLLVRNDRGRNVRNRSGYSALAARVFESVNVEVRHQRWIPYTHCLMECTRS